jgi:restriction system protein
MIPALLIPGVVLAAFSYRIARRQTKGSMGEWKVSRMLTGIEANAMHNVILPGKRGLTQIDHLVLTHSGILVLETKNYGGSLYDQGRRRPWRQRIGSQTHYPHNPLDQNYGHCKAVEAIARHARVEGFVVLAGSGRFPEGAPDGVLTIRELKRELRELQSRKPDDAIWPALVKGWDALRDANQKDPASREKQMRQVTGGGLDYWLQTGWPWMMGAGLIFLLGGYWG